MEIIKDNSITLDSLIKTAKTVVVVITTQWCPPCKKMAPIWEELSKELVDTKIFKVDATESAPQFVIDMGIKSVPTILFYRNGVLFDNITGERNKQQLLAILNK